MKILEMHYVPNPVVLKKLAESSGRDVKGIRHSAENYRRYLRGEEHIEVDTSNIVNRVLVYLGNYSKCDPDTALEAFERLQKELELSEYAAALIVNIRPRIPEEAMDIIRIALRESIDLEKAERIVQVLDEVCRPLGE